MPPPALPLPDRARLLIVLALGTGLLLGSCLGGGVVSLFRVLPSLGGGTWPRKDFERAFMGKTLSQVRAELGAPDEISIPDQLWTYKQRTRDEKSGKMDAAVTLQYTDERITWIRFTPQK